MRLSTTDQRRSLWVLASAVLASGIAVIVWAVWPIEDQMSHVDSVVEKESEGDRLVAPSEPPDPIAPVSLRGPLYDPPPVQPTPRAQQPRPRPTAPPPPTLALTLVGTVIDPNGNLAIIADATGKFDIKGVGQELELPPGGVTIAKIDSESVSLIHAGREVIVELDRSAKKKVKTDSTRPNNRRRNNR